MRRRSTILICGGAGLFSAACGDISVAGGTGSGDDLGAGGDVGAGNDVGTSDAVLGPTDTDEADIRAGEADTDAPDDDVTAGEDAGPTPEDATAEDAGQPDGGDAPEPTDTAVADVEAVDAGAADIEGPLDVEGPADIAESFDVPDPADVAASGPVAGDACDGLNPVWCDETATLALSCTYDGTAFVWTAYKSDGIPCFCDPASSPGFGVCAAVGFVGITRAGRSRHAPPLRALRRAA